MGVVWVTTLCPSPSTRLCVTHSYGECHISRFPSVSFSPFASSSSSIYPSDTVGAATTPYTTIECGRGVYVLEVVRIVLTTKFGRTYGIIRIIPYDPGSVDSRSLSTGRRNRDHLGDV